MHGLWLFFLRNRQFTVLLMIALLGAGTFAVIQIPKESAPEVRIPVGIVSTTLPGASAADVEALVTNEIERAVANLDNLSKLTSTSREGLSIVTVEFEADADLDKSIQDLKDAVDVAVPELPREANDPVVSDVNFAEQPILLLAITGEYAPPVLTQLAEDVADELETVNGVSRVEVSGVRDPEIQVVVQKDRLELYGLSLSDVVAALQASNASLPVGSVTVDGVKYAINFEGDLEAADDLNSVSMRAPSGATVYVRDIAEIVDGLEEPTSISRASVGGEPSAPSLSLSIFKSPGGNIAAVAENARDRLAELQDGILADSEVVIVLDQGEQVRKDLAELLEVGFETIILVTLTLLITIGWREAIIAAVSVPLSFLIAFIGLLYSGNTINFVSLFSLILAIGILVDSGIVVVEAIHTRLSRYGTSEEAAEASIREYAWPLIGGTMTTVAVFVPLFFISGIVGEFISSIPFTIIFVLMASIFVALGLVPLIAVRFTKRERNDLEKRQEEYTERFQTWYRHQLSRILDSRRTQNWFLVGICLALVVAIALPITGLVSTTFFPQEDIEFIYIEIETPQGTALTETDLVARRVEEALYGRTEIESFSTTIGASSAFNQNPSSGSNVANITITLSDDRARTSTEIVEEMRNSIESIEGGIIRVYEPSNGPPSGAPVLITFLSDDLDALEAVTAQAESILRETPGTTGVTSSVKDSGLEFIVTIDRAKAAQHGLSPTSIAQTLRTAVQGTVATTIKDPESDRDIVVKLDLNPTYGDPSETTIVSPEALRAISLQTQQGPVLMGSVVDISLGRGKATIRHENRKRIETVSADVESNTTAPVVTAEFERLAKERLQLPENVEMKIGGETEDINQSFTEMGFAFIAGIVLMFAILVLEFNSIRHTLYLLSIVPLSMIGVSAGLFLTGQPLSFSSLLGVIALAGVIINHGIILLDSMHRISDAKHTFPFKEVVIEASVSRLRAIILTTITTVIGMIPLAGASALWGPLAFAIMFGLSFATILTLVHIPILAYRWPGKWKRT
ncbi:MAG TPA: efflux RND transporter permease subunit [Candidatus Paceibacterota bacterium]|nr:efflux RND transporter permease subunit [Candidatus Paceibacterota bacterium]